MIKNKLYTAGVRTKFIKILISLYSQANVSVKGKEGRSELLEVTEGVMQGETLSPMICNLYIADLEEYLINRGGREVSKKQFKEILLEAYADGIAIMSDNIVEMIKIVNILQGYCQEDELKINVYKTKVVVFHKGGGVMVILKSIPR